ncbi:MAG TPA: hypothetical protein VFN97_08070 [Actinospica sp.]|nr:hypothetical protein [Actinospica sp.]
MGIRDLARSLGYEGEHIDLGFVLDIPLPEPRMQELERWGREKASGYEVVTWVGMPPQQWREAYCRFHLLDDLELPPEHRNPVPLTVEMLESQARAYSSESAWLSIDALILAPDGAPAAHSRVIVPRASGQGQGQWAVEDWTLVLAAHRGRRLSALAKLANLRELAQHSPQTRTLHAEVPVTDEAMFAVNERFGYRPATEPQHA